MDYYLEPFLNGNLYIKNHSKSFTSYSFWTESIHWTLSTNYTLARISTAGWLSFTDLFSIIPRGRIHWANSPIYRGIICLLPLKIFLSYIHLLTSSFLMTVPFHILFNPSIPNTSCWLTIILEGGIRWANSSIYRDFICLHYSWIFLYLHPGWQFLSSYSSIYLYRQYLLLVDYHSSGDIHWANFSIYRDITFLRSLKSFSLTYIFWHLHSWWQFLSPYSSIYLYRQYLLLVDYHLQRSYSLDNSSINRSIINLHSLTIFLSYIYLLIISSFLMLSAGWLSF